MPCGSARCRSRLPLLIILVLAASLLPAPPADAGMMRIYAASAAKPFLDVAAKNFGVLADLEVKAVTGGSGTMLRLMRLTRSGDLFISSSETVSAQAAASGVIDPKTRTVLSPLALALYVRPGNPRGLRSVGDVIDQNLPLAVCTPEKSGAGAWTREWIHRWLLPDERIVLDGLATADLPDSESAASVIALGRSEAAIGWRVVGLNHRSVETVDMPAGGQTGYGRLTIAVSRYTHQKAMARAFIDYLRAPEGQDILRRYGYLVAPSPDTPGIPFPGSTDNEPAPERPLSIPGAD